MSQLESSEVFDPHTGRLSLTVMPGSRWETESGEAARHAGSQNKRHPIPGPNVFTATLRSNDPMSGYGWINTIRAGWNPGDRKK